MASALNETSRRLFAPIASDYERWARILSVGQDDRWRRTMVEGLGLDAGSNVLDVAAGTGSITRLLQIRGHHVTPVDLSFDMLSRHTARNRVLARAELLPFADASFDAVSSGYLLRYVEDPVACLSELSRVVRSGGVIGMVEFGMPSRIIRPAWRLYAGVLLPGFGRLISPGWHEVARFLRPSIEDFHRRHPDSVAMWEKAGLVDVRVRWLSLGSGLVTWARKP
jgi:demethylmenaquinone methyltransferase/2-methoxy-6-polyprenyl-1,4-benzoquinol methylase